MSKRRRSDRNDRSSRHGPGHRCIVGDTAVLPERTTGPYVDSSVRGVDDVPHRRLRRPPLRLCLNRLVQRGISVGNRPARHAEASFGTSVAMDLLPIERSCNSYARIHSLSRRRRPTIVVFLQFVLRGRNQCDAAASRRKGGVRPVHAVPTMKSLITLASSGPRSSWRKCPAPAIVTCD